VPFIQKLEIDAVLNQNPIRLVDRRPLDQVVQQARAAMLGLAPYVVQPVLPLPQELERAVEGVRTGEVFNREYAAKFDVSFGMVPLDSLISPQPLADLDYVDELADSLSSEPDLGRDFEFAFPQGTIPEPAVVGNTVTFATHAPNIYVTPAPTYRKVPGGYEVVVRAESKPNYLFVAQLGGRLMLVNGVHHVLALIRAGREHAPAVIGQATMLQELGLGQTTLLNQFGAARPPLVKDFFSPCAVPVLRRAMGNATQVVVQSGQATFPIDGFVG
jgi:hypothetical protein